MSRKKKLTNSEREARAEAIYDKALSFAERLNAICVETDPIARSKLMEEWKKNPIYDDKWKKRARARVR